MKKAIYFFIENREEKTRVHHKNGLSIGFALSVVWVSQCRKNIIILFLQFLCGWDLL